MDAYSYQGRLDEDGPALIGVLINDAYRYMGWLSTVPLPSVEFLRVMKLDEADCQSKACILGLGYTLMIVFGYYGEMVVICVFTRFICWFVPTGSSCCVVYELLDGFGVATAFETDPVIATTVSLWMRGRAAKPQLQSTWTGFRPCVCRRLKSSW